MIFIDMRDGSDALLPLLRKAGLPAEPAEPQLEFGDVFWVGRGEKGKPVRIGVEYKTVADVVSSIRTARLQGHQLPGMRAALAGKKPLYDFAYLLIEGELNYDANGRILRRKGKRDFTPMEGGFTIDELIKRLNVMHMCAGLNYVFSADKHFSVAWLAATYRTWTDTDLDKHKSHLAIYEPPTLVPVSQFVRTVRTLPSVGLAVARIAEKRFRTISAACNASVESWAELETVNDGKKRRFGVLNAAKVKEAIR
jgi:ERCC4-type nuclease